MDFDIGRPFSFVAGERALLVRSEKALVIGDMHIGIEGDFARAGIRLPSRTVEMEERIMQLIKKTRARTLVILGDVKHRVPGTSWQEEKEVPRLLEALSGMAELHVVLGNHDDGLEAMGISAQFHSSEGFRLGEVFLAHGHAWPGSEFLGSEYLVTSHIHPQVEFTDKIGGVWREPVWLMVPAVKTVLARQYPGKPKPSVRDIVLMPGFNRFLGGFAVNRKGRPSLPRGLMRAMRMTQGRVFMLDGTYLGEVREL